MRQNLTKISLFILSVGLSWAPLARGEPMPPGGQGEHLDAEAGVRFQVPFAEYTTKTGPQVEALVYEEPALIRGEDGLRDSLRFTSGVYDQKSNAYILVWTVSRPELPTRWALDELSRNSRSGSTEGLGLKSFRFDSKRLRGVGRQMPQMGLQARVLVQLVREATVYVGFYYEKKAAAPLFATIVKTLRVDRERALSRRDLPWGGLERLRQIGGPTTMPILLSMGVVGFSLLGVVLIRRAYRPHR